LDHYNKCRHVESLSKEKNVACAVIYRSGADDKHIQWVAKISSNLYYISLEEERSTLVDISSTKIREKYENSMSTDNDDFTYPHVNDFLKKKYKK
jgi:hypothetical protein